jgi:hypothetical protein
MLKEKGKSRKSIRGGRGHRNHRKHIFRPLWEQEINNNKKKTWKILKYLEIKHTLK